MSDEEQSSAPELVDPATKLILVVDDDDGQRDLMGAIVKKEGFRLDAVSDGKAAIRKASELPPDLILLDLMLPGLGGYEVIRELQATGLGSVPVIVFTARTMDQKAIDLIKMEPNVRDVVSKPPRTQALAAAMHALLMTRPLGARRTEDHWGP